MRLLACNPRGMRFRRALVTRKRVDTQIEHDRLRCLYIGACVGGKASEGNCNLFVFPAVCLCKCRCQTNCKCAMSPEWSCLSRSMANPQDCRRRASGTKGSTFVGRARRWNQIKISGLKKSTLSTRSRSGNVEKPTPSLKRYL